MQLKTDLKKNLVRHESMSFSPSLLQVQLLKTEFPRIKPALKHYMARGQGYSTFTKASHIKHRDKIAVKSINNVEHSISLDFPNSVETHS